MGNIHISGFLYIRSAILTTQGRKSTHPQLQQNRLLRRCCSPCSIAIRDSSDRTSKLFSLATRLAIGTALKPVAPISGLIFFLEKRFTNFTNKIPPVMERANARKPPTTMPIVVQFRKASVVIVAPTDSPRKIVAAFMMLLEAASNRRNVLVPISFTRLPNISIPINGTALGTKRATTVVTTIGKIIFKTRRFLISVFEGYIFSCSFILMLNSFLVQSSLTTSGIITGTSAMYE